MPANYKSRSAPYLLCVARDRGRRRGREWTQWKVGRVSAFLCLNPWSSLVIDLLWTRTLRGTSFLGQAKDFPVCLAVVGQVVLFTGNVQDSSRSVFGCGMQMNTNPFVLAINQELFLCSPSLYWSPSSTSASCLTPPLRW